MDMEEAKYTVDGRKVVVIETLPSSNIVVQEIYVSEAGEEIQGGTKFIVGRLLDAPPQTWKEKRLKEEETLFDKLREDWDRKIKQLRKEKESIYKSLETQVKWLKSVSKEPHPDQLKKVIETLAMFLSSEDKWIFVSQYGKWYIKKFSEFGVTELIKDLEYSCDKPVDYMQCLSLGIGPDNEFHWKLAEYSDGSGDKKDVVFFSNKEAVLEYAQQLLYSMGRYSFCEIENAEKLGLKLDEKKLKAYKEEQKKNYLNLKEVLLRRIAELDLEIEKLSC